MHPPTSMHSASLESRAPRSATYSVGPPEPRYPAWEAAAAAPPAATQQRYEQAVAPIEKKKKKKKKHKQKQKQAMEPTSALSLPPLSAAPLHPSRSYEREQEAATPRFAGDGADTMRTQMQMIKKKKKKKKKSHRNDGERSSGGARGGEHVTAVDEDEASQRDIEALRRKMRRHRSHREGSSRRHERR